MKSFLVLLGHCMLVLMISACGKKANEKEKRPYEDIVAPTRGEIYYKAYSEVIDAIEKNDLPRLEKVYANYPGIDLNEPMIKGGETFLTKAIQEDYLGIRDFLLDRFCDIEKTNIAKETPLMVAVKKNRLNSVKVLLDLKADPNKKNKEGNTALHIAIKARNEEIALLLINHKADIDYKDELNRDAYYLSREFNLLNVEKRIQQIEYGVPDLVTFKNTVIQGDVPTLEAMISRFPTITQEYESINPLALVVDVQDEMAALTSALILIKGSANINGPKNALVTPLIKATMSSKNQFAKLYLERNADPQILDADGKSALIHAIEVNNLELVKLLLSKSALEVYSFRKNGEQKTFDACKVAKETSKRAKTSQEKASIKEIQHELDCGLLSWIF